MFVFLVEPIFCKTLAVLINASKSFFNYRHGTNTRAMGAVLRAAGLPAENILRVQREDPHDDPRNLFKGRMHISESEYISVFKEKNDRTERITEHSVLRLFGLRHRFLMDLDREDNVIFYMCGHAREEFFKVCDRYMIFRNDLMRALLEMAQRVRRALVILDTCQASTLIDAERLPGNICVVTSSLGEEFSYSNSNVEALGVLGIDDFVLAVYRSEVPVNGKVAEYFEGLGSREVHLSSTVRCWGNRSYIFKDFISDEESTKEGGVRVFPV